MPSLYPAPLHTGDALPSTDQFTVAAVDGKVGMGVRAREGFARGSLVARFTGQLSGCILQHTLQVSPQTHIHDPHFVGLLTHSCAPNCVLDMARLEVRALVEVRPGQLLTIDYAATEDVLHRQFACGCGAPSCRLWITGRREQVDATGRAYLDGLAGDRVTRLRGAQ